MIENLQNIKTCQKKLCCVFAIILGIFLIALTVSIIVGIQNKIKEGKYIGQEIESKNTISVTESGEIYAKPDLAIIIFSVANEAKTVATAMTENTEKMNSVIEAIKKEGVEDKDLKTISFNIYPRYEYVKEEIEIYLYPPGKRVLVGYEVSQGLQVKIRNLEKIGTIIEKATDSGANQVGDLQLTIDKEDDFKKQARAQAIEKAKAKAKELASQLGIKLVRITNFTESSEFPYFYRFAEAVPSGLGGGEAPSIQTGENKITVTVTITYEIN